MGDGSFGAPAVLSKKQESLYRYELIPNAESGSVKINSAGFRGPEIKIEKPKDTYRILMLGDSELFAVLLPENDSLSRQLEKLLNEKSSGLKFEVINTGWKGIILSRSLRFLKIKA